MPQDHQEILSALATAVRDLERRIESLSAAVTINGGTFNNAGRDICNYITYSFCPSPNLLHPARGNLFHEALAVRAFISSTCAASELEQLSGSPLDLAAPLPGSVPLQFQGLAISLQTVSHQVQPHANDILGEVQHIINELGDLIAFSSSLYNDLGTTELANRVRAAVDNRISECTSALLCTHRELDGLVYRRLPLLGRLYYALLGRWWYKWEPREVAAIREALSSEARSFAEWLLCLKL
jgi:hypothetical protein